MHVLFCFDYFSGCFRIYDSSMNFNENFNLPLTKKGKNNSCIFIVCLMYLHYVHLFGYRKVVHAHDNGVNIAAASDDLQQGHQSDGRRAPGAALQNQLVLQLSK